MPQGEPKNGAPFSAGYSGDPGLAEAYAKVDRLQAAVSGEAKNNRPFTDSVGVSDPGFSWVDASIGALAVLGACLLVLAGLRSLCAGAAAACAAASGTHSRRRSSGCRSRRAVRRACVTAGTQRV